MQCKAEETGSGAARAVLRRTRKMSLHRTGLRAISKCVAGLIKREEMRQQVVTAANARRLMGAKFWWEKVYTARQGPQLSCNLWKKSECGAAAALRRERLRHRTWVLSSRTRQKLGDAIIRALLAILPAPVSSKFTLRLSER